MSRFSSLAVCFFSLFLFSTPSLAWQDVVLKKSESINSVAEKYRPHSVSTVDMVIAIRSVNPGLKNKTTLDAGSHLHLPTTVLEVRKAIIAKHSLVSVHAASAAHGQAKKESLAKGVAPHSVAAVSSAAGKETLAKGSLPHSVSVVSSSKTGLKKGSVPHSVAAVSNSTGKTSLDQKALMLQLQQTIANQNQAIQAYQAQISALSQPHSWLGQIGMGSFFSSTTLLGGLWLVTLILFLRARYHLHLLKNKKCLEDKPEHEPILSMSPQSEIVEPSFESTLPLHTAEPEEKWEQVELDIPDSTEPTQAHIPLEPSLSYEEQAELVGEQQNIIKAINSDHDNIEWHRALLEFYVKTNNQAGFNRHFQNMLKGHLMIEGDALWEEIRKMYLNQWIYNSGV